MSPGKQNAQPTCIFFIISHSYQLESDKWRGYQGSYGFPRIQTVGKLRGAGLLCGVLGYPAGPRSLCAPTSITSSRGKSFKTNQYHQFILFNFEIRSASTQHHIHRYLNHLSHIIMTALRSQPPTSEAYLVSYPAQYVVLLTINRPNVMNCIHSQGHWDMDAFFTWFDNEPSLRVAIITGAGPKAFCAGQDLIEQGRFKVNPPPKSSRQHPPGGFAGVSRRIGKKPIIAAVNGFALGGGFEITLNWLGTLFCVSGKS